MKIPELQRGRPPRESAQGYVHQEREQKRYQLELFRVSLKPYEETIFSLYNGYELSNIGELAHVRMLSSLLQLFPERKPDLCNETIERQGMRFMQMLTGETVKQHLVSDLVQLFPNRRAELQQYVEREQLRSQSAKVVRNTNGIFGGSSEDHFWDYLTAWFDYTVIFPEYRDEQLQKELYKNIEQHREEVGHWELNALAECKVILPEYPWKTLIPSLELPDVSAELDYFKDVEITDHQRLTLNQTTVLRRRLHHLYCLAILYADRAIVDSSGLHLETAAMKKGTVPLPQRSIV